MREWMYKSTQSWHRHWLEASGKLHSPAALPPKKKPRYPLDRRLGGLDDVERRKLLPLPEFELRSIGCRYNDCATPTTLELNPLAESIENCNEISGSVKCKEFLLEKGAIVILFTCVYNLFVYFLISVISCWSAGRPSVFKLSSVPYSSSYE
jgi:hypothetical protein